MIYGGWLVTNSALPTTLPMSLTALFMANSQLTSVLADGLSPQLMEKYLQVSTIENGALEKKNHPERPKEN